MIIRYEWLRIGACCLLWANVAFADATQAWVLSDSVKTQSSPASIRSEIPRLPVLDYARSEAQYLIPDVHLTDQEGKDTNLRQLIEYGGPVMMQFIFATCSTICPVLSASFASSQHDLDAIGQAYRFISISIDPEQDTPEKLKDYAKRFKAGTNWYFLTGANEEIARILNAFDARYSGNNKMYHQPLTFMLARGGDQWIRIEGLLSKNDVIREYQNLLHMPLQSND